MKTNLTLAQVTSREDLNKFIVEQKKANGPCPVCKKNHTYEKKFPFGKGQIPSKRLASCPKFREKTPHERGKIIESLKACYSCLDPNHEGKDCRYLSKNKCTEMVGSSQCGEPHHKLLHNCGVAYCHNTHAISPYNDSQVLFEIQEIDMPGVSTAAVVMFDGCSSACLIRHGYAAEAGFEGKPVKYFLQSTGYPARLKTTTLYEFSMMEITGEDRRVSALGIDQITESLTSLIIQTSAK